MNALLQADLPGTVSVVNVEPTLESSNGGTVLVEPSVTATSDSWFISPGRYGGAVACAPIVGCYMSSSSTAAISLQMLNESLAPASIPFTLTYSAFAEAGTTFPRGYETSAIADLFVTTNTFVYFQSPFPILRFGGQLPFAVQDQLVSFLVVIPANEAITLDFQASVFGSAFIPEPQTTLMMATGLVSLLGAAVLLRKRKAP